MSLTELDVGIARIARQVVREILDDDQTAAAVSITRLLTLTDRHPPEIRHSMLTKMFVALATDSSHFLLEAVGDVDIARRVLQSLQDGDQLSAQYPDLASPPTEQRNAT